MARASFIPPKGGFINDLAAMRHQMETGKMSVSDEEAEQAIEALCGFCSDADDVRSMISILGLTEVLDSMRNR